MGCQAAIGVRRWGCCGRVWWVDKRLPIKNDNYVLWWKKMTIPCDCVKFIIKFGKIGEEL
jgi:hypothetical protein